MYPLPITSDDIFKYKILTGDIANPPEATNRTQMYLLALITGNKNVPQAITRLDIYMRAAILGDIMIQDLPIPITRSDMYWYTIATGLKNNIPEPITREDMFDYSLATESAIREWLEVSGTKIVIPNSRQGYSKELGIRGRTLQNPIGYIDGIESTGSKEGNKISIRSRGTDIRIEDNEGKIVKTGTWSTWNSASVSGGSEIFTNSTGSVELTFNGTGIRYISDIGTTNGIAKVTVDGISQNVDLYSSNTLFQQVVFEKSLTQGSHTIKVEFTGTKNPLSTNPKIVLDCFEIITNDPQVVEWQLTEPLRSLPNGVCDEIDKTGLETRRVGKRLYQTGDENNPNFITDKVDTLYPLTTSVTKQLTKQNIATFEGGTVLECINNCPGDIMATVPINGSI